MKNISELIKQKRKLFGWSLKDTAQKFELTTTGYAKIENGETAITVDRLYQLAEVFGVSVGELLGLEGTGSVPNGEQPREMEALEKENERLQNRLREVTSEKNIVLFGIESLLFFNNILVDSDLSIEELKKKLQKATEDFRKELEKLKPQGEPPIDLPNDIPNF